MRVLCFAAGSSSLKYGIFDADENGERELLAESIDVSAAATDIFAKVEGKGISPEAVGHRIVFGGMHAAPVLAEPGILRELRGYVPIDPLHLPVQLRMIEEIAAAAPALPQVLCFDTAFHRRMPEIAQRFALPDSIDPLVRRYGYHGLSYEYVASHVDWKRWHRVVIAHLGNGASLAAMRDGEPVDTTMGFTPLGGIMMGTRPGDIDPGVLLYLLRSGEFTIEGLDHLLTQQSGLLGVSGTTADMRELLARRSGDLAAELAVQLFVYAAAKFIGAMAVTLGGLDLLVFTGGIGENSEDIRRMIGARLGIFEGMEIRVIPTNETRMIARHTLRLCS
jgi:acetate kinase